MNLFRNITAALCALLLAASCSQGQKQEIVPPYLHPGDTIGVMTIATATTSRPSKIDSIIVKAKELYGFNFRLAPHTFDDAALPFAASDAERGAELQSFIDDPSIKAIMFIRGGYGTVRVLDHVNWDSMTKHPKWIVGFSDLTVLHSKMRNLGIQSIHGPHIATLHPYYEFDTAGFYLFEALQGNPHEYEFEGHPDNRKGSVKAPIVGGNMNLLASGIGTDNDIDVKGCILLIEDTDEPMNKMDSYLQQLKRSGKLSQIKGLMLGYYTDIDTEGWNRDMHDLLKEYADELKGIPIAYNVKVGHHYPNYPIIMGREVELKVTKEKSTIKFL